MKILRCTIPLICFSLTFFLFSSCGVFFQEVECRDFEFKGEEYWFPERVGELVTFVDEDDNEKVYTVAKKEIRHTTMYYTETGCGCRDRSNMVLISGTDTIYLLRVSVYQYDKPMDVQEDVVFLFNRDHSIFFESEFSGFENIVIDSVQLNDARVYENNYTEGRRINYVVMAKGIGVAQYRKQDGMVFTNKVLSRSADNTVKSFVFNEIVCD